MKERIVPSLAEPVGTLWKDLQTQYTKKESAFFVATPLSSTPLPIYEWIIQNAEKFPNWDKVRFVLMDEILEGDKPPFAYVSVSDLASYEGFARKHLLNPLSQKVSIPTEVVKPEADNIEAFDTEIDLLILAIGVKGNYANVMTGLKLVTGIIGKYFNRRFNLKQYMRNLP